MVVVGGRGPVARSLGVALALLAGTVLALAGVEVALVAQAGGAPLWLPAMFPLLGVIHTGAGTVAWRRRPSNRIGTILVAGGASYLGAGLVDTELPALVAVGTVLAEVPLAVVVHLLHAFPSGRLRGAPSRVLVVAAYVIALVAPAPRYLFTPLPAPDGLLAVADRPDLAVWSDRLQWVGAVVMVATAVILVRRWRGVSRARRSLLGPLYAYGVFAAVAVSVLGRAQDVLGLAAEPRSAAQLIVLAGVPVAFAAVLLRGGFARTGQIEELGAWLGGGADTPPAPGAALAATLGDPSLRLVFPVGDGPAEAVERGAGGYVDADGAPVQLPAPGSRAVMAIEQGGRAVGAIVYDATLIADPDEVRAAGRVVGLAVRAQRLTAELRASQEALRRSRVRLVEAADRERRRIAQDLHDGLQVQLVLLALDAGQVAKSAADTADTADIALRDAASALRAGIDDAAAALRRTVHAVMPAALIERGLATATEDLVDRLPLPARLELHVADGALPAAVEATAYFVLAEGLANALKHAQAHELAVRVAHEDGRVVVEVRDDGIGGAALTRGTGLRGLADRVDVLGGRLRVHSPAGGGTRLVAELPHRSEPACGS